MARLSAGGSFSEEVGRPATEAPTLVVCGREATAVLSGRLLSSSPSPDGAVPASTHEWFRLAQDTGKKCRSPSSVGVQDNIHGEDMLRARVRLPTEAGKGFGVWLVIFKPVSNPELFMKEESQQTGSAKSASEPPVSPSLSR
ncbi:hypothetical protein E2C01_072976 [Portunus trituberculatus]|uniref:Uncharacterized protein n=1 Tax=Portunus trituberculatus TaxID=210409 RepID=A0A5B7I9C6_PORTR|nr:hypothetical protein [Portunus trituberculatus]